VAVVAAGELDDDLAPGEPPGQADGGHGRLGARGNEPHPLDRGHQAAEGLGELDLGQWWDVHPVHYAMHIAQAQDALVARG